MPGFKYPENSFVVAVDADSFEKFIKTHDRAFIHFGGVWNGVDKMIIPAVVEAAMRLKTKVGFAVFDVDTNEQFCLKHQVLNVPFIEYYESGRLLEAFVGRDPAYKLLQRLLNEFGES